VPLKVAPATASTVGPQTLTFDFTSYAANEITGDASDVWDASEGGSYTFALKDDGSDADTVELDGDGLHIVTAGGGATKREYNEQNGVGYEIDLATLFPTIAQGDMVEVGLQWKDDNSSTANFCGIGVQFHDNASPNDMLGIVYGHGYGVRMLQRINDSCSNVGTVATSPANTPPNVLALRSVSSNYAVGYYDNGGSLSATPGSHTFVAHARHTNSQTVTPFDISGAYLRVWCESHGSTSMEAWLEKMVVTWWPAVTT
jgi:hypothetical protein